MRGAARSLVGLLSLPARPVPRGRRVRGVAVDLIGAAVAGAAAWWIGTTVAPAVPAMQVLTAFGVIIAGCLLVSAALRLRRRSFPPPATRLIAGRPAIGLHAWAAEHWLEIVVDCALALTCLGVLIADAARGGRWLPWTLLLLVPIVWFGGLAAAALTGRRNPEGLWVVDDDLVHESGWGRELAPLADCRAMTVSGTVLVLVFVEPTQRTICPRPWRPPLPASGEMRVETAALAVPAAELGRWLAPALPDDCDVRLGE